MRMMINMGDGGGGRGGDRMMAAGAQAATAVAGQPSATSSTSATAGSQGKPVEMNARAGAGDPKAANEPKGAAPGPAANNATTSGDRAVAEQRAGAMRMPPNLPALPTVVAADLPDYMPPFANASARPDADANLWVRTTTPGSAPGNVVYDVINNKGELTDRVDVPRGMSIVGFGRGGVVYLTLRGPDGLRLVRATMH